MRDMLVENTRNLNTVRYNSYFLLLSVLFHPRLDKDLSKSMNTNAWLQFYASKFYQLLCGFSQSA